MFDAAHSEAEERWFTLGITGDGRLLAVSHTYCIMDTTNTQIRLISARDATHRDSTTTRTNRDKMTYEPTLTQDNDDMPAEIDFSGGMRGKFFRPGALLQLPIHLDAHVQNTLASLANAKGIDLSVFVNDLLKKDIELIQMGR